MTIVLIQLYTLYTCNYVYNYSLLNCNYIASRVINPKQANPPDNMLLFYHEDEK